MNIFDLLEGVPVLTHKSEDGNKMLLAFWNGSDYKLQYFEVIRNTWEVFLIKEEDYYSSDDLYRMWDAEDQAQKTFNFILGIEEGDIVK